ncbi:hypothetical protein GCM10020358_26180 [Amorphoplanes nipponensis]|uniref:Uncharacterized protein n=1 Tax=Actinoplanes nipponensis TaxID=135950 RepID=A0A919MQD0_9ACTN|nr:hypothetical protein [Actinoplanes nipponensis]GIE53002.1 hypothetical protein Ani05nite_65360 [Actinoplanes nipponensis]
MSGESLTVESRSLPPSQVARLLTAGSADLPGVTFSVAAGPGHRSIDPGVAAAVVSGAFGLLGPFMIKLAERLFAAEPGAGLSLDGAPGHATVVLTPAMSTEDAAELVAKALAAGARNVRITIEDEAT